MTSPRDGAIRWRSLEYPAAAAPQNTDEAAPALSHIWESVIRHVTKALCALEKTAEPKADPVSAILTQDHIAAPWLRTLRALTGEGSPPERPGSPVS
ncbi:MAG: hypothetical protein M3072_08395 [Candidatus Dormibacteraeota bacterium]|nr:hypothetical protein [Candidatus Dormibacteraeota bacterium]